MTAASPSVPRARRQGAIAVTVAAAFTLTTGKDHWHVLLRRTRDRIAVLRDRGRAVRQHFGTRVSYGHARSGALGHGRGECSDGPGYAIASVDHTLIERVRTRCKACVTAALTQSGRIANAVAHGATRVRRAAPKCRAESLSRKRAPPPPHAELQLFGMSATLIL